MSAIAFEVMTAGHQLTFILGGARSGKSAYAERLAADSGLAPVYVATAQALDAEMEQRIALHRQRRNASWRTVEEPLALAASIAAVALPGTFVVVDCLTLWLTNILLAGRDPDAEADELVDTLSTAMVPLALISNEVGQGIVPAGELSRRFVDAAGRLHQAVAAVAGRVVLMTAGIPLDLKPRQA